MGMKTAFFAVALIGALPACAAFAGSLTVSAVDAGGKPLEDAVVEVVPDKAAAAIASRVPAEAEIDQRHEMFVSLVSVVRKGGHIVFLNHDTTMHQVYSFSPIKQFQFEIRQGQHTDPVVFDKPGIAAVGCNIHDQMITYVYVADSPFAAITGTAGLAKFADLPAGSYQARIWHPRLRAGDQPAPHHLTIAKGDTTDSFALPVQPASRHSMHMGSY